MVTHEHPARVPFTGLAIAFLVPVAFAGVTALLLAQDGPHNLVLAGLPRDSFRSLGAASERDATFPREEAVASAMQEAESHGAMRVRDIGIGRYGDDALDETLRGRLVWVVTFFPEEESEVFVSGPAERDRSCDWAWHYGYVFVELDAETGEFVMSGSGAYFDPTLPPTYDRPGNSDQAYCERLLEREREAARSP